MGRQLSFNGRTSVTTVIHCFNSAQRFQLWIITYPYPAKWQLKGISCSEAFNTLHNVKVTRKIKNCRGCSILIRFMLLWPSSDRTYASKVTPTEDYAFVSGRPQIYTGTNFQLRIQNWIMVSFILVQFHWMQNSWLFTISLTGVPMTHSAMDHVYTPEKKKGLQSKQVRTKEYHWTHPREEKKQCMGRLIIRGI